MPLHFFTIPVFQPQPPQDDLNYFLASHRVVWLEKQCPGRRLPGCAVERGFS
jgi:hypothetical protein